MGCCADNKSKCCGISKVVIPAALGGHDGEYAPQNGAYQNTLVYYEASGVSYLYANDGSFEKLADGIAATIEVGETTTLTPGSDATVENVGTKYHAKLNFGIPQGEKGDAATISVGSTTTGAAGTDASVVNSGDEHAAVLDFTIPRGDKGDQGDAATINVGTVTATTLEPGQQASATVTNSGTTENAVLDFGFGIPKGEKGDTGATGSIKSELVDPLPATGQEDTYYLTNDSATKGTVTGNPISFDIDTEYGGKIEELKLNGNAEQTTYSGKNLFGGLTYLMQNNMASWSLTNNILTFTPANTTGNPNITFSLGTPIASGTTVHLSSANAISTATQLRDNDMNIVANFGSSYDLTRTLSGTATRITFNWASDGTTNTKTVNLQTLQIEAGSTATSYEPYVGGTASPNPDYPQPISTVTGAQNIKVEGKNLCAGLNSGYYDISSKALIDTSSTRFKGFKVVVDSGTYTLSCNTKINVVRAFTDYDNSGNVIFSGTQTNINSFTMNVTQATTLYLSFRRNDNTDWLDTDLIQLELGSQASDYQPYQGQSYTIDLGSIELAKIGNYQDYIWNDGGTWKVHKAVDKVVVDGSTTLTQLQASTNTTRVVATISSEYGAPLSTVQLPLCDYFVGTSSVWATDDIQGTYIQSRYAVLRANNTTVGATLDSFKTWLSTHPTTVYYALATATDTEITEQALIDQLNAVASAQLYSGENNIMNIAFSPNLAGELEIGYASWVPGDRYDVYIWNDSTGWQIIHTADS